MLGASNRIPEALREFAGKRWRLFLHSGIHSERKVIGSESGKIPQTGKAFVIWLAATEASNDPDHPQFWQ
jgi:hypothetical protein